MLRPVQTRSLPDEVFGQLLGEIVSGRYAPGETLPGERGLSDVFGVNRHVVREALKRLREEFDDNLDAAATLGTLLQLLGHAAHCLSDPHQVIETFEAFAPEIVFLDEMPLNPTGKVDRAGLKLLAEDHLHPHGIG